MSSVKDQVWYKFWRQDRFKIKEQVKEQDISNKVWRPVGLKVTSQVGHEVWGHVWQVMQ